MSFLSRLSRTTLATVSFFAGVIAAALISLALVPSDSAPQQPTVAHNVADANSVSTRQGGLLLVQQLGRDNFGNPVHTGAPVAVIITDAPTIQDLCNAALAVNNYGADNPQQEDAYLNKFCNQAHTDLTAKHNDACGIDLIQLARNVNTGFDGDYRLASAFTLGNVAKACLDTAQYNFDLTNTLVNEPVLYGKF